MVVGVVIIPVWTDAMEDEEVGGVSTCINTDTFNHFTSRGRMSTSVSKRGVGIRLETNLEGLYQVNPGGRSKEK